MTSPSEVLRVDGLSVGRGAFPVVRDVTFSIADSEVVALLGPNGAGKSSLVDGLSGMARKYGGRVRFAGADITTARPAAIARAGLSQVSQTRDLFGDMTVAENVDLGCLALGGRKAPTADFISDLFPILTERAQQRAASLSGGEQQMLAIARGLMSAPRVLILDEPTTGLAPVIVAKIGSLLQDLAAGGLTVLLVEQNVDIALATCSRFLVLRNGRLTFDGPRDELGDDPRESIAAHYL